MLPMKLNIAAVFARPIKIAQLILQAAKQCLYLQLWQTKQTILRH
jgi:hypothetical protein